MADKQPPARDLRGIRTHTEVALICLETVCPEERTVIDTVITLLMITWCSSTT